MECVRINILYFQKELVNICLHKDTKESSETWKGVGISVMSYPLGCGKDNMELECAKHMRRIANGDWGQKVVPFFISI